MSEDEKEDRLVLNTKKSLYDPIEIVIDNQVYQAKKTTRAVLKEVDALDEQIQKAPTDVGLLYKAVQLLFDIDSKILDKLEKREVEDIYTFSKKKFIEIEMQRADLVAKTFGKALIVGKEKTKETIPSRKRPGSKQ